MGSRGIAPLFINLGTKWKWVVNFTRLSLCPRKSLGAHWIGGGVGPRSVLDKFGLLFSFPRFERLTA
jgi:hypothetical protein